jgi:hypothetical protein
MPTSVNTWCKENRRGREILLNEAEYYFSNGFPILNLPATYIHSLGAQEYHPNRGSFPYYRIGNHIISFARAKDLNIQNSKTHTGSTQDFVNRPLHGVPIDNKVGKNAVIYLGGYGRAIFLILAFQHTR